MILPKLPVQTEYILSDIGDAPCEVMDIGSKTWRDLNWNNPHADIYYIRVMPKFPDTLCDIECTLFYDDKNMMKNSFYRSHRPELI